MGCIRLKHPSAESIIVIQSEETLTVAGSSQHLSRLIQLRLQTISNIWSWNYTTENEQTLKGDTNSFPFNVKMCRVENRSLEGF